MRDRMKVATKGFENVRGSMKVAYKGFDKVDARIFVEGFRWYVAI